MPYNPGITDQRGAIWQQALGNIGTSVSQGIQQYQANKQLAGQSIAQFEATAKNYPDILQFLENDQSKAPDAVKSAYQALKTGGTVPLQKATLLAQFAASYGQQKQASQESQARDLQLQTAQLQFAAQKRQQDYLNSILQGGPAGPGGSPASPAPLAAPLPPSSMAPNGVPSVPGGTPMAPAQTPGVAQSGPPNAAPAALAQFVQGYARAVGAFPPPEAIEKFMTAQMGRETPIGVVSGAVGVDKDGRPNSQSYNWVYRKGDGSTRVDTSPMSLPYGSKPPGQQLDPDTFTPITSATAPTAQPKDPVIMTPERQKALEDSTTHLNLLQANEDKITKMEQAVAAYIKQNPQGMRTNPAMGTHAGLALRQMVFGDTTGQLVNQGVANNLNAIMENMRGESKSLGMRLTGTEWDQLKQAFPKTTDAPDVMLSGMENVKRANAFSKEYAQAYVKNLRTMSPGDAAAAANDAVRKAFPSPVQGMPQVKNKEDYDALPSGLHTPFKTPGGQIRYKP